MTRRFWFVGTFACFFACSGSDDHPGQILPGVGTGGRTMLDSSGGKAGSMTSSGGAPGEAGQAGSAGSDGSAEAGSEQGGEGGMDELAPDVVITSPAEVTDPDDGEVVVGDTVTVTCTANQSSASGSYPVDVNSVTIDLLNASGDTVREGIVESTGERGEYQSTFQLTTIPSGAVQFRCAANDTSSARRSREATLQTFVDHGPTITVMSPTENGAYALNAVVPFEFTVEPTELAAGDEGAAVSDISLTVDGIPFDVSEDPKHPNVYVTELDFTDRTVFQHTPSGEVPVVITATNERKPDAATNTEGYTFTLDGDGPVVKITSPTPSNKTIIGRDVTLAFTVTDELSGVNKESVVVRLNDDEYPFEPPPSAWTEKNGTFTFQFDSTKLKGSKVQATINIFAEDEAGNAAPGTSLDVYLDQVAPRVSLNPGPVRVVATANNPATCSQAFDPLGSAVNDEDSVDDFPLIRALVWEETNDAGQPILYYAGADQTSVRLFLQPDETQPLLTDADGDDECDTIIETDSEGKPLKLMQLTALQPSGTAPHFTDDRESAVPTVPNEFCTFSSDPNLRTLCTDHHSDMYKVIKHEIADATEPVIYAVSPKPGDLACTGDTWEIGTLAGPGWACLAARATDKVGNVGISPPLRICVNPGGGTSDACDGIAPPSCTDGCTPPPNFEGGIFSYTLP